MHTACECFEKMAFNELEEQRNFEYDSCSHVWISSIASGTAFTDYCVKCDLMYSTPRKRTRQRISDNIMNDIKQINSFYMSKIGVTSHDDFVRFMSQNGVIVNVKIKKHLAKKMFRELVDFYPYLSDMDLAKELEKKFMGFSKDEPDTNGLSR